MLSIDIVAGMDWVPSEPMVIQDPWYFPAHVLDPAPARGTPDVSRLHDQIWRVPVNLYCADGLIGYTFHYILLHSSSQTQTIGTPALLQPHSKYFKLTCCVYCRLICSKMVSKYWVSDVRAVLANHNMIWFDSIWSFIWGSKRVSAYLKYK